MPTLVTIAAFLATLCGALALYGWLENRKESLPSRFRKIAAGAGAPRRTLLGDAGKRLAELKKQLLTRPPDADELLEMFTGKELSGARLLLSRAGPGYWAGFQWM